METSIATTTAQSDSIFHVKGDIGQAIQVAKVLASSSMVPSQYQGEKNISNVVVAMELGHRIGISPFMVMQNLHVIQGRPSWASPFLIAMIQQSGKFEPLRFEITGTGDARGCVAWTHLRASGERLEGPRVDIAMAKAEGWYNRSGSKWKTMPEVMLRYRSAAFFARLYAYDLLCGLQTMDEVYDIDPVEVRPESTAKLTQELLEEEAVILAPTPEETAVLIPDEPTPEPAPDLPSEDEKKDLWREYEEIFGNRNHAVNAAKLVTDGRGSKEWTNTDLKNLKADMKRRVAEKKDDAPAEKEKAPAKGKEKPKEALKEKPGSWSFSDGDDAGAEEDAENILF